MKIPGLMDRWTDEETVKVPKRCVPQQHKDKGNDLLLPLAKGMFEVGEIMIEGATKPMWNKCNHKYLGQAWQTEVHVKKRQDDEVWNVLWKINLPCIVQEFIYKLLWKETGRRG